MADKKKVLIGTYWTGQFDRWRGYYNYPIALGDKISEADCKEVTELWLFKGVSDPRYREVEFVGIVSRKELVEKYGYRSNRAKHADRYFLFKTKALKKPSRTADKVLLRVRDFAKRSPKIAQQLREFLLSADRKNPKLALRLPKIVVGIPTERLCLFYRIADSCRISSPPCVKDEGPTIDSTFERDVQECDIPLDVLAELLKDRTTGDNVLWMTDDYKIGTANVPRVAKSLCDMYHPVWNRFVFQGSDDVMTEHWRELHSKNEHGCGESTLRKRVRNYLECA